MLSKAMHRKPKVQVLRDASKSYHKTMRNRALNNFPKVTLSIYEHALLDYISYHIIECTLLDGRSWFLVSVH
jgi:hypothetical protein